MKEFFCSKCSKRIRGKGRTGLCSVCALKEFSNWNRGLTKETDERVARMAEKMSKVKKGITPWNKGLTKETSKIVREQLNYISGSIYTSFGKPCSVETRQKISKANKGQVPWLKGKTGVYSEKTIVKMREAALRRWKTKEYQEKMQKGLKIKPNKTEQQLNILLQKLFSEKYKYIGDFQKFIGGKNPDFINEEDKKIIEFFGDYWHSEEMTNKKREQEEQERIEHFQKYGFQTLIIWETELEDLQQLKTKIIKFTKGD